MLSVYIQIVQSLYVLNVFVQSVQSVYVQSVQCVRAECVRAQCIRAEFADCVRAVWVRAECTCRVCTCTSAPLSEVTNLTKELNACTDDIKTWMTENQLKLNDDKTEALLFPFSSSWKASTVFLPHLTIIRSHNIPFYDSERKLGFILHSKLSMKKHVIKICQTAYFELKRISSIRKFITEDATKTLVTSYILSWLDYCNCLLVGTPNSVIQPLQKIQSFAARLVLLAPRHHHSTSLLEKLRQIIFVKCLMKLARFTQEMKPMTKA